MERARQPRRPRGPEQRHDLAAREQLSDGLVVIDHGLSRFLFRTFSGTARGMVCQDVNSVLLFRFVRSLLPTLTEVRKTLN
jgi:hypothetical protein